MQCMLSVIQFSEADLLSVYVLHLLNLLLVPCWEILSLKILKVNVDPLRLVCMKGLVIPSAAIVFGYQRNTIRWYLFYKEMQR